MSRTGRTTSEVNRLRWRITAEFASWRAAHTARRLIGALPRELAPQRPAVVTDVTTEYALYLDPATAAWWVATARGSADPRELLGLVVEDMEEWLDVTDPTWRTTYLDDGGHPRLPDDY